LKRSGLAAVFYSVIFFNENEEVASFAIHIFGSIRS